MYPNIFALAAANSAVRAALGTAPVRFFPFGEAPEGVAYPYAVWRTISGNPENYLGDAPNIDTWLLQVDVYAATASTARSAAQALRDVIETTAYIVSWRGEDRDPVTKRYHYGFDVEWMQSR